jgi:hypothetical protein
MNHLLALFLLGGLGPIFKAESGNSGGKFRKYRGNCSASVSKINLAAYHEQRSHHIGINRTKHHDITTSRYGSIITERFTRWAVSRLRR